MRHRDDATRDKAFEKILAAGQRASRITNSILGFARNRPQGFEPVDLVKLIDDSLLLLEREMVKYRVLVEKQFQSVPPAMANANQIQQVLVNLLVNARQAMPNGGQIIIRLTHDAAHGTVDLMVRDSGCGIAPDKLPQIFDRFFTTKSGPDASGKGGTGLGLSFCRDVVEAHQGRIRVESTVGKGTAFTLKLPAARLPEPTNVPFSVPASERTPSSGCQRLIGAASKGPPLRLWAALSVAAAGAAGLRWPENLPPSTICYNGRRNSTAQSASTISATVT